jgi:hypothetical protein
MITGWPNSFCNCGWMLRMATSVPPPAGNGTTTVMARLGQLWACADGKPMHVAAIPRKTASECLRDKEWVKVGTVAPQILNDSLIVEMEPAEH